jgi:hypothetical protein
MYVGFLKVVVMLVRELGFWRTFGLILMEELKSYGHGVAGFLR